MIDKEPSLSSDSSTKTLDTPRTAAAEKKGRWRCGEVVGSGTAECAAICCCCPCGLIELLVLGLYKLPAGLCRKAWRKRKRQRIVKKRKKRGFSGNGKEMEAEVDRGTVNGEVCFPDTAEAEEEVVDWEKEMMERFPGLVSGEKGETKFFYCGSHFSNVAALFLPHRCQIDYR